MTCPDCYTGSPGSDGGPDGPAEDCPTCAAQREADALALSMLACRRAGVERPTLVRDESGAALDPANSRHYVSMLRRAADLVGADRVLVVSHSPEVQELCDERIEVGHG